MGKIQKTMRISNSFPCDLEKLIKAHELKGLALETLAGQLQEAAAMLLADAATIKKSARLLGNDQNPMFTIRTDYMHLDGLTIRNY